VGVVPAGGNEMEEFVFTPKMKLRFLKIMTDEPIYSYHYIAVICAFTPFHKEKMSFLSLICISWVYFYRKVNEYLSNGFNGEE
jgi:hypothetical protein